MERLKGRNPQQLETPAFPTEVVPDATPNVSQTKPEPSLQEQAQEIDNLLDPLLTEQVQRNCETDAVVSQIRALVLKMQELYSKKTDQQLMTFNSFDEWLASHPRLREVLRGRWRVELLNQSMYLISAPFLAIVTYYIL
jgi:hypothetical protein